ncbi:InlB B-repeat-containing protein [Treponema vincentii]|uniref:InlB B-repeat-containing protein n=1 Tax=Treponema vincentii TaxID=69710 RepID=UPI0020A5E521|nr:InlB B-repeat-containing protein [Treponema vincentii]UTC48133.1 hypothetical protein E4N73_04450 [Treponema vincentii]
MRKAFIIVTGILFTLLSAACRPFTADIGSYLGYWSSEAFVVSADINAETQNDASGMVSVASAKDVIITLKVQNPKSFKLVMPSASETRNIVDFAQLTGTKPVVDSDYTLEQPDDDRKVLTLTYKAGFLQNSEWGEKDVSSTITLYADDGREFKYPYTFKIKANTPPATPGFTVAKTKDLPAYYVLCITVPDMDKKVQGSRLLHKDITRIEVNGTPYPFSVNEAENRFEKPESGLFMSYSAVEKLDDSDAADVPTGGWVLYYKTDVEVREGAAKKDYTVRLADAKGLVSGILNASTKPNKAEAEKVDITKGNISGSGSGSSEGDPVIIACDSTGAALKVSSATAGVTVHGTLTDTGTAESTQYNGNPITVPLPLNSDGEKTYKLEYYTDGEGFARTDVKTVYYKILKGHTVTFDANSGEYPDGTTAVSKVALHGMAVSAPDPRPKKQGFGVTGWYKDKACSAGKAWNFATDTVTGDMTLYAQWTAGADTPYKVEHYQQNVNDDKYPAAPTDTDNATGTTGTNAAVTLKNYPGFETGTYTAATIAADGSTVVKVLYKRKQITVTFDPNGGTIDGNTGKKSVTGKYGAPLTAPTASWIGHTFSGWNPPLSAGSTFPAENAEYTAQWDLNSYTVTYNVVGGNGKIQAGPGTSTTNGTIPVTYGGNVTFTADPDTGYEVKEWTVDGNVVSGNTSTSYELSTVTEAKTVTVKFKKKVYNVTFSVDGGHGTISATPQDGSASSTSPVSVEHGKKVTFTAVPHTGYEVEKWMVGGNTVSGNTSTSYELSTVTEAKNVTVKFKKKVYNVTFSVDGGHGTISATPQDGSASSTSPVSVEHGKKVTFTAVPHTGYEVEKWMVGGNTVSGNTSTSYELSTVTEAKNVTVKFKKKTYTVRFSVADGVGELKGEYNDGTSHSNTAQNGGGEVKLENVPYGTQVDFTATPATSAGAWKVAGWKKNDAAVNETNSTYTLSNVTSNTTVTVTFYQSEIDGTAPMAWRALLNAVSDAPDGATLKISGTIQATNYGSGNNANYGKISIDKDLTIKGEGGAGILDANQLSPIFIVQHNKTFTLDHMTLKNGKKEGAPQYTGSTGCGVYTYGTFNMQDSTITNCEAVGDGGGVYVTSEGTCIMKNSTITGCTATEDGGGVCVSGGIFKMQGSSTITGCTASKGGGVYVSSGTFKMQDSAIVTLSTGSEQYTAGKNDVYLESGKRITVDSTLTGTTPVARITPREYTAGHSYLTGSGVGTHHLKFTVPPQKVTEDSENWNVFWYIADNGNLKAEVEDPVMLQMVITGSSNNTIIKLGNISDLKTVEIWGYRKIMLKADRAVTLTCPKKIQNDYKHLRVQEHASLILKGPITLQGADYGSNSQHALFVENGGKAEIKDGVIITGFKNGNIGPVVSDGNLTMSGGEISGNKAKNGGGVYIHATWRYFTMTGGTIKGNTADKGGGVYVNGSLNGGYPIRGQFLMKGGTITGNTAETNGKAVLVYYADFKWEGGQITANTGNGAAVATELSGNFNNASGNTES